MEDGDYDVKQANRYCHGRRRQRRRVLRKTSHERHKAEEDKAVEGNDNGAKNYSEEDEQIDITTAASSEKHKDEMTRQASDRRVSKTEVDNSESTIRWAQGGVEEAALTTTFSNVNNDTTEETFDGNNNSNKEKGVYFQETTYSFLTFHSSWKRKRILFSIGLIVFFFQISMLGIMILNAFYPVWRTMEVDNPEDHVIFPAHVMRIHPVIQFVPGG